MTENDDLERVRSRFGAFARPDAPARPEVATEDAASAPDLIVRARSEGAPVDVSELAENPFARRSAWRSVLRTAGSRGWAAAALAIAVLALGWHLRPTASPEDVSRASPDAVVRLKADDPRALRQQIVSELRARGVQANGYEQLGINGIDAMLPEPLPAEVRRVLDHYRIPIPPDGVLRIELTPTRGE